MCSHTLPHPFTPGIQWYRGSQWPVGKFHIGHSVVDMLNKLPSRGTSDVSQRRKHHPFHSAMAQVYNDFNQDSPPDILSLANERLLMPKCQQRTSKLKNYFQGYKEYSDTPPSPAPSDEDQLFLYLDQSNTNLGEVAPISPSRRVLLQNPSEAESQGKDNCSLIPLQG